MAQGGKGDGASVGGGVERKTQEVEELLEQQAFVPSALLDGNSKLIESQTKWKYSAFFYLLHIFIFSFMLNKPECNLNLIFLENQIVVETI